MATNLIKMPQVKPLWYQLPSWRATDRGILRKIISYPRRHGKDFEDLSLAARDAIVRNGTYYYIFPTRKWAKRAIWDTVVEIGGSSKFLIDHLFPPEIVKRKNETDLFLELINGSMFFMGGSDNLDFVGQGGQGYTLSEFSLHKEAVTSLLAPIIRQSQAYLRMNGTLRGKGNQLYKMLMENKEHKDWFVSWIQPEQTKLYCWVSDEMQVNPEIMPLIGQIDPKTSKVFANCQGVPYWNIQDDIDSGLCSFAYARQEFLNSVVNHVVGGYYGYEMKKLEDDKRVQKINPNAELVYTFWDLGGVKKESDATAVLFAQIDVLSGNVKIVDYYENTGHLRGHYWDVVKKKGYNYGGHYYPHDGKRTNEYNGEDHSDTARREFGVDVRFVPKTQNVLNDIEVTRRGFVNYSFDEDRTQRLLEHVGNYHERESSGKPCHNNACAECGGASHGADTLRCMSMAIKLGLVTPYLEKEDFYHRDKYEENYEDEYFIV